MKYGWILLASACVLGFLGIYLELRHRKKEVSTKPRPTFEDLLDAIAWVESQNNPNAVGDKGNAIGMYQIWKIYVDDVNRIIAGRIKYKYRYFDRYDPEKSRQMVRIYLRWYGRKTRLGRDVTLEDLARIHNGGPNGYKKKLTIKYWKKVKRAMR